MTNKMMGVALAAALALTLTGCKQKSPADQVRKTDLPKAGQNDQNSNANGVAIVDIDSLANKYTYCIEGQKKLQAQENGYRQQLNAKIQALQKAGMDFQNKAQSGALNQQQAQAAQASLQRQQQSLQAYQQKIEADMSKATQKYQTVLRDSLKSFLKDYNADGRYKVIISKSGDNVLYAAPGVDITDEVIAGLNKRYKK